MFYTVSKLFWIVVAPSHVILWLMLGATAFMLLGRQKAGKRLAVAASAAWILFGVLPLGHIMVQQIEDQVPRPAWPPHVDGILILGGGNDPQILRTRGAIANDHGVPRLIEAYIAARHYPQATVVFAGGSGYLDRPYRSESIAARYALLGMGLDPARLTLESKSRNTWENFVFAKQMVGPRPQETWLLATSAFHMPRALAIAKKVGWNVTAWPTDYMTLPALRYSFLNILENLEQVDMAAHEYIGLWIYRLSGKSA